MARKSVAGLSVVSIGGRARLEAPDDLTEEQSALWRAVADSKPVDWFDQDSAPLLKEYVRAAVASDWLEEQVRLAMAGDDVSALDKTMRLRDMESKRVSSLGTKLRLTPQSRYNPASANTANNKVRSGERPWQFGEK